MKAVFVDFDGVFHPSSEILGKNLGIMALQGAQPILQSGLFRWTPILEDILSRCEADEDIAIVVHSSWRSMPWASPQLLRELLGPLGHRFEGIVNRNLPREASIIDYVERASIDDFIILDDAQHEFDSLLPRLVSTNPLTGLEDTCTQQLISSWIISTENAALAPACR